MITGGGGRWRGSARGGGGIERERRDRTMILSEPSRNGIGRENCCNLFNAKVEWPRAGIGLYRAITIISIATRPWKWHNNMHREGLQRFHYISLRASHAVASNDPEIKRNCISGGSWLVGGRPAKDLLILLFRKIVALFEGGVRKFAASCKGGSTGTTPQSPSWKGCAVTADYYYTYRIEESWFNFMAPFFLKSSPVAHFFKHSSFIYTYIYISMVILLLWLEFGYVDQVRNICKAMLWNNFRTLIRKSL